MVWSDESRTEVPITEVSSGVVADQIAFDWSPDGERLLVSLQSNETHHTEIWMIPASPPASFENRAWHKLASDPAADLYQPHFSPDGRWIVFEDIRHLPKAASTIYVVPTTGGAWTRITKGIIWDDKPRWSPDGRTIYYVSGQGGLFNVWGIRFDPNKGKPIGKPFQVTSLEKPSLMVPNFMPYVGFSIAQDKLSITATEQSGSIWVLDNVDR
jgi:Tol biopolymer transport system component